MMTSLTQDCADCLPLPDESTLFSAIRRYNYLAEDIKEFFNFVKGMKEAPAPGLISVDQCLSEFRQLTSAGS